MLEEIPAPLLMAVRLDGVGLPAYLGSSSLWASSVGGGRKRKDAWDHSSCLVGFSLILQRFQIHDASDKIGRHILSPHELNSLSQSIIITWDKTDATRVAPLPYHAKSKWDTQEAAKSIFRGTFFAVVCSNISST